MTKRIFLFLLALCLICAACAAFALTAARDPEYIEATGTAVVPVGASGARGKALARRGAVIDLQRKLLLKAGVGDRSDVSGFISGVEIFEGAWDGKSYTVLGRVRVRQ